jgi:hypothetical protein
VRNIFYDDGNGSIKAMQAPGTLFWQCNVALGGVAQQLAEANHLAVADVRANILAGPNPGVRLVPSHVMALARVQDGLHVHEALTRTADEQSGKGRRPAVPNRDSAF